MSKMSKTQFTFNDPKSSIIILVLGYVAILALLYWLIVIRGCIIGVNRPQTIPPEATGSPPEQKQALRGSIIPPKPPQAKLGLFTVTAYCPCERCCGAYADGITASGHVIQAGDKFVAADRKYPFGTLLIVPGYNNSKPVPVLDRGGAIIGNHIDVFFQSHQEALKWGRKKLTIQILE